MSAVILRATLATAAGTATPTAQVAVAVAAMTVPSVTASAAGGTRIALDYRETLNLLADTLGMTHGRADAICQQMLDAAHKLAELTR